MNKIELKDEIEIEIKNLNRLDEEMRNLLLRIDDKPTFIETRAAASILHDSYSGIEKIFGKVALFIDKKLPEGENWHIELLSQMAKPFANIRPPIISEDLFEKLKKYLDFRHLFRHIYGFELKWERFKGLCTELENILKELIFELGKFISDFEGKD